ncbi:MAG: PolC-type DNA polymerase III, partial [Erysipelotrichaceae bacterium]|nr:PolC-type DNA polymerase III [Erysipelotrichaceae bacterium]
VSFKKPETDDTVSRTYMNNGYTGAKLYSRNQRGTAQHHDLDRSSFMFTPMNRVKQDMDRICVTGKVFKVEYQTMKSRLDLQKIFMTEDGDAVIVKRFEGRDLPSAELHAVEEGKVYTVYGNVRYDSYDRSDMIEPLLIEEVAEDPFSRSDDYEGTKHADLHVHTNKTEMDGISKCEDIINQAFEFGQPAIAITDIGVVQAYPLAQDALLNIDRRHPDNDFKVIYGTEMKVADEKLQIVYNADDQKISTAAYCVLDLETTGLSTKYDHIIEFGGIIVRNNLVDGTNRRLQMFIKPPVSIPPFIEKKTNITNEMLQDAPSFEQAIDKILEFIGDRVVVAHNADFDFNFLNEKLIETGRKPLKNVCLDTLNLSRAYVKNRKYYRLGLIARNFGVEYDDEVAHRGDYDAEVLAQILTRMLPTIPDWREKTFRDLQEVQDEENYKKARTYNVTLLAKNQAGVKAIYELISLSHTKYLTYFAKENAKKADSDVIAEPRIIRSEIEKRRENLLIGSCNIYSELFEMACNRSDEAVSKCMDFSDYVEVQPLACFKSGIVEGSSMDVERLQNIVRTIIAIAESKNKIVIANNDVYYTHPYQKIARDIYIMAKRIGGSRHPLYPMNRQKRLSFVGPDQHLMTTQEMLDAFDFLPAEKAKELVIDDPLKLIADIPKMYPVPQKLAVPSIDGCEEKLTKIIYENAYARYGNPLPDIVRERIEKELNSVITNGFSVQYYIAYLLVKKSNEDGFIVGSRGSVGSSLIATMANITEVNPLVPHYLWPHGQHSEFLTNNDYANGFDLPRKNCPHCGTEMERNGHSIPFETFLGFKGDKVPDIDLNFSAEYQNKAQLLIREIFGDNWSYRAGTIGTVAQKTAYGYIKGYCEEMEMM